MSIFLSSRARIRTPSQQHADLARLNPNVVTAGRGAHERRPERTFRTRVVAGASVERKPSASSRMLHGGRLHPDVIAIPCPLVCAQEGASNFYAVWDHWLLDTLASWQKQSEASYAISLDEERGESPPPTFHDHVAQQLAGIKREHVADDMSDALTSVPLNSGVPLRKRKAPEADDLPHSQIFRT